MAEIELHYTLAETGEVIVCVCKKADVWSLEAVVWAAKRVLRYDIRLAVAAEPGAAAEPSGAAAPRGVELRDDADWHRALARWDARAAQRQAAKAGVHCRDFVARLAAAAGGGDAPDDAVLDAVWEFAHQPRNLVGVDAELLATLLARTLRSPAAASCVKAVWKLCELQTVFNLGRRVADAGFPDAWLALLAGAAPIHGAFDDDVATDDDPRVAACGALYALARAQPVALVALARSAEGLAALAKCAQFRDDGPTSIIMSKSNSKLRRSRSGSRRNLRRNSDVLICRALDALFLAVASAPPDVHRDFVRRFGALINCARWIGGFGLERNVLVSLAITRALALRLAADAPPQPKSRAAQTTPPRDGAAAAKHAAAADDAVPDGAPQSAAPRAHRASSAPHVPGATAALRAAVDVALSSKSARVVELAVLTAHALSALDFAMAAEAAATFAAAAHELLGRLAADGTALFGADGDAADVARSAMFLTLANVARRSPRAAAESRHVPGLVQSFQSAGPRSRLALAHAILALARDGAAAGDLLGRAAFRALTDAVETAAAGARADLVAPLAAAVELLSRRRDGDAATVDKDGDFVPALTAADSAALGPPDVSGRRLRISGESARGTGSQGDGASVSLASASRPESARDYDDGATGDFSCDFTGDTASADAAADAAADADADAAAADAPAAQCWMPWHTRMVLRTLVVVASSRARLAQPAARGVRREDSGVSAAAGAAACAPSDYLAAWLGDVIASLLVAAVRVAQRGVARRCGETLALLASRGLVRTLAVYVRHLMRPTAAAVGTRAAAKKPRALEAERAAVTLLRLVGCVAASRASASSGPRAADLKVALDTMTALSLAVISVLDGAVVPDGAAAGGGAAARRLGRGLLPPTGGATWCGGGAPSRDNAAHFVPMRLEALELVYQLLQAGIDVDVRVVCILEKVMLGAAPAVAAPAAACLFRLVIERGPKFAALLESSVVHVCAECLDAAAHDGSVIEAALFAMQKMTSSSKRYRVDVAKACSANLALLLPIPRHAAGALRVLLNVSVDVDACGVVARAALRVLVKMAKPEDAAAGFPAGAAVRDETRDLATSVLSNLARDALCVQLMHLDKLQETTFRHRPAAQDEPVFPGTSMAAAADATGKPLKGRAVEKARPASARAAAALSLSRPVSAPLPASRSGSLSFAQPLDRWLATTFSKDSAADAGARRDDEQSLSPADGADARLIASLSWQRPSRLLWATTLPDAAHDVAQRHFSMGHVGGSPLRRGGSDSAAYDQRRGTMQRLAAQRAQSAASLPRPGSHRAGAATTRDGDDPWTPKVLGATSPDDTKHRGGVCVLARGSVGELEQLDRRSGYAMGDDGAPSPCCDGRARHPAARATRSSSSAAAETRWAMATRSSCASSASKARASATRCRRPDPRQRKPVFGTRAIIPGRRRRSRPATRSSTGPRARERLVRFEIDGELCHLFRSSRVCSEVVDPGDFQAPLRVAPLWDPDRTPCDYSRLVAPSSGADHLADRGAVAFGDAAPCPCVDQHYMPHLIGTMQHGWGELERSAIPLTATRQRRDAVVLPKEAPPPAPAAPAPFLLEKSVFAARVREADSRHFFNSKKVYSTMFDMDWNRMCELPRFPKWTARLAGFPKGAAPPAFLEAIKAECWGVYKQLLLVMDHYGLKSQVGDPFDLGMNPFLLFCKDCGTNAAPDESLLDESLTSEVAQRIFVQVNVEVGQSKALASANDDDALMRYEFLEAILRLIEHKFDLAQGSTAAQVKAAFAAFQTQHLGVAAVRDLEDSDAFRTDVLYTAAVSDAFRKHEQALRDVYDTLALAIPVHGKPTFRLPDWHKFFDAAGLLSSRSTRSTAVAAFVHARMRSVDETKHGFRNLPWVSFLEAIARIVHSSFDVPPKYALDDVGVTELTEFYEAVSNLAQQGGASRDDVKAAKILRLLQPRARHATLAEQLLLVLPYVLQNFAVSHRGVLATKTRTLNLERHLSAAQKQKWISASAGLPKITLASVEHLVVASSTKRGSMRASLTDGAGDGAGDGSPAKPLD